MAAIDAALSWLPDELRVVLRPPESDGGAVVVEGLELGDWELGPTPASWDQATPDEFDVVMLVLARCAGEPFGWLGQQYGRLVNNIVPARGHEDEQTGASSSTLLCPHTEDAFHPWRSNLLLLGCLRNPDRVGTTVASVRRTRLSAGDRETLSRPTVPILPDASYGDGYTRCAPLATLWSSAAGTTLRYDPAYTPLDDAPPDFRDAYRRLGDELERVSSTAVLAPGELLLIDNDVVVHGRVPFTARYDGTDRWLKRVNIRLPERRRRPSEATESGYGQQLNQPAWRSLVTV